jgi:DNA-binding PadR family transcriptional regulator
MSDAELAILSLIAEAPKSGMDIQQVIDARNLRAWTLIGTQSIYYVIEKLEKQGLIEPTEEKQYHLTAAGIGVLQTSIMDRLSTPHHLPYSFDIGLANLTVLKTAQVRHALQTYRSGLQARHDFLKEQLNHLQTQDIPFHIVSMYEHQITLLKAELAWFDGWYESWEMQAPDDPEPQIKVSEPQPRMQQRILPHEPDSFHKKSTVQARDPDVPLEEYPPPPQKRDESHKHETRISRGTDLLTPDDE